VSSKSVRAIAFYFPQFHPIPGADEGQLSLELLREGCGIDCSLATPIEQEANERIAIFTTIIRRTGAK